MMYKIWINVLLVCCLISVNDVQRWKTPCDDKQKCYCSNGGTCYNLDTLAKCICHCTLFFTGDHCQYMNPINKECKRKMEIKLFGTKIEIDVDCEYVEWILEPTDLLYKLANSIPQQLKKGILKLPSYE